MQDYVWMNELEPGRVARMNDGERGVLLKGARTARDFSTEQVGLGRGDWEFFGPSIARQLEVTETNLQRLCP